MVKLFAMLSLTGRRSPCNAPSAPAIRPWGSKALINACIDYRHIKNFSKRTKLSKETYEQVVARWNELGFSEKPPVQTVFEDSAPGSKVE